MKILASLETLSVAVRPEPTSSWLQPREGQLSLEKGREVCLFLPLLVVPSRLTSLIFMTYTSPVGVYVCAINK